MSTDVDSGPEIIAHGVRIKMGGHVEDLAATGHDDSSTETER
jgi:hypothetical protein